MRAALRDASWFRKPSTRDELRVYHVVLGTKLAACGIPSLLLTETDRDAEEVSERQRCRRSGCLQRWPDLTP